MLKFRLAIFSAIICVAFFCSASSCDDALRDTRCARSSVPADNWAVSGKNHAQMLSVPIALRRTKSVSKGIGTIEDILILAGGDVLLDRGVRSAPGFEGSGATLFDGIAKYLSEADLAFANLECPLANKCYCLPKQYCFRGDIAKARGLKLAGFDLVTLANNHVYDCGRDAIAETIAALKDAGVEFAGAGLNFADAMKPAVFDIGGVRIAVLSVTPFPLEGLGWNPDAPTPAFSYEDEMIAAVAKAKKSADLLIVSIHWGREYSPLASAHQKRLAQKLAAAGADAIVGHHPHVLEPCVKIGKTWVAYSLGNLLFDSRRPEARLTALMRLHVNPATKKIEVDFAPLEIVRARPEIASPEAAEKIAGFLNGVSDEKMWVYRDGIISSAKR